MSAERCPQDEVLHDCLVGKLPEEAAETLFDHLDDCPACRAKLQTAGNLGDTSIDWLREPWRRDEYQDEPQLQEAVARAKAIGERLASCNQADAGNAAEQDILGQLDDYQVLEKLAEGGMGSVYKALHTRMGREVALKLLPASSFKNERAIVRFEREIQIVGQLDHPHIVRALDARVVEGNRLLVLEYIDGEDLSRLVHCHGPLPVAEACELVRQAAVGLQHAHQHGVIHRDVKPSNLMLDQQGQVKILDLGLARFRSDESSGDMTRDGQMMGTPGYMSPEQASDTHSVDIRTDIYGLGCTLYYLLVGRAPYPGETAYQILRAHEMGPIPSLRDERDDVPEALDRVFQRMVAKTPAERHDSMSEVIADLDNCLAETGGIDAVATASVPSCAVLPLKRHKRLAIALLSLAALVLLAFLVIKFRTPSGAWKLRIGQQRAKVVVDSGQPRTARPEDTGRRSATDTASGVTPSLSARAKQGEPPPLAVASFGPEQARQHQQAWADHLGMPIAWSNSLGMEFVLIPPGEFLMGSSPEEQTRFLEEARAVEDRWAMARIPQEGPLHRVQISRPFYLGKCEVTQAQWEAVMGNNPSMFKDSDGPVDSVNWHDARFFSERLDALSASRAGSPSIAWETLGMTYTLPTEAQWEYACRAGTTTAFSCGDDQDALDEYAWYRANSGEETRAVGQLKPNAWALHDMHGNVWEWCADWDAPNYYADAPPIDPPGAPMGSTKIFRGGSWGHPSCSLRSAFRRALSPDYRYQSFGFRLAVVWSDESTRCRRRRKLADAR
jgi:serine/threonine protein kinase/formylglycine-generating enzyme required for sulfatase activity